MKSSLLLYMYKSPGGLFVIRGRLILIRSSFSFHIKQLLIQSDMCTPLSRCYNFSETWETNPWEVNQAHFIHPSQNDFTQCLWNLQVQVASYSHFCGVLFCISRARGSPSPNYSNLGGEFIIGTVVYFNIVVCTVHLYILYCSDKQSDSRVLLWLQALDLIFYSACLR